MKPGAIVYRGLLPDRRKVLIRRIKAGDAEAMRLYINTLSKEKTFIRYQGEQVSPSSERKYVLSELRALKGHKGTHLLLFVGGKLAGNSAVKLKDKTQSHVGSFGLSIAKQFRGLGLGRLLMGTVLKEAKKLPGIKIVRLEVFKENKIARTLYESMGFKEFGILPGAEHRRGRYSDEVFMYRKFR